MYYEYVYKDINFFPCYDFCIVILELSRQCGIFKQWLSTIPPISTK